MLTLSKKRLYLIDKILRRIPSSNCYSPQIYINRQLASQYYENPTVYADYQNTVFMQIYKSLKTEPNTYNFRYYNKKNKFIQKKDFTSICFKME